MNGEGRLLLECDLSGTVLWMSAPARNRLGTPPNLLETIAEASRPKAARLLSPDGDREVFCLYRRPDASEPMPLRLRRIMGGHDSVFLLAAPAQRATDRLLRDGVPIGNGIPLIEHLPALTKACLELESEVARTGRPSVGSRILREVERERTRLARDLHAGAGQSLAGILLYLDLIDSARPHLPERAADCLDRIRLLACEAAEQLRSASHRLHPPKWQGLKLRDALDRLCNIAGISEKYRARIELAELPFEPCQAIRTAAYRFCQEAISNIVRHSHATCVGLRLYTSGNCLWVTIDDDGCGFTPPGNGAAGVVSSGIGLVAMCDQASELGGNVEIESGPGGTRLRICLPFTEVDS